MSHAMKSKRGYRPDLGFRCDSKVEANVARILKHLGIEFQPYATSKRKICFEDLGFKDEKKGRPLKEMHPDFYLPKEDAYLEVKGTWNSFTSNDRKRLIGALMKGAKIIEICGPVYEMLEKTYKEKIKEWE